MPFKRGDKVKDGPDGLVMEVLASSDNLTLCGFEDGGVARQSVFETRKLLQVAVQQQQQQQPQSQPPKDKPD
jgi:hypothetical protein